MNITELKTELNQFTGTERYYLHFSDFRYTDGIKQLAEKAEAYWLIDVIASYQSEPKVKSLSIQFWRLNVADKKATIICQEDTGIKPVVTQKIEYTDFPEGEIMLYVQNGVLFLPSEY